MIVENCTQEYDFYGDTEKLLLGTIALPLILTGILANAISVLIFSNRMMRAQPINWYLLLMALSDAFILISAFFVLTLPRLGETLLIWEATAFSYYMTPYMYAMMTFAQTLSVWMTTIMSIHRFIGVCVPYKAKTILTHRNVRHSIAFVIAASVFFNATRMFEVYIAHVCYMVPINVELPVIQPTALRLNWLYRKIFYELAYTLIMFAIPFTILIIVNSLVIGVIHRSRKEHAKLNLYDDGLRKQESAKEFTTSVMLVAIVVAFLLCNTPIFIVNVFEQLDLQDLYRALVPWSNVLVMANASINICIYCLFSEKYRQILSVYFRVIFRPIGGSRQSAPLMPI